MMYKEKWAQMIQFIKRKNSDDSDELVNIEEDYER